MSHPEPSSTDRLEEAKDLVWDAVQLLEDAQRVLFKAGDHYVVQVWGDGVKAIIDVAEKITDLSGDLTTVHIEIGRLARKDRARGTLPPG